VVAALSEYGVAVTIINRTYERAQALATSLGAVAVEWDKRAKHLEGADLLVNTTVLGMAGKERLDLDLSSLPKSAWVADIVYSPLETELLAAARKRGNVAIDGLGMLLHQARPAFAAWFGHEPQVTVALRKHVLAAA
jgi:shikimate dehydrogenase